jgi:hypothetical protein
VEAQTFDESAARALVNDLKANDTKCDCIYSYWNQGKRHTVIRTLIIEIIKSTSGVSAHCCGYLLYYTIYIYIYTTLFIKFYSVLTICFTNLLQKQQNIFPGILVMNIYNKFLPSPQSVPPKGNTSLRLQGSLIHNSVAGSRTSVEFFSYMVPSINTHIIYKN